MPARTKSCATCRKKRIRCDATSPACLMCVQHGRQCPGLAEGPMIVDMTKTARHGMQKRKRKNSSISAVAGVRIKPDVGTVCNISPQAMITEAFYGRFLSCWTSEGDGKDLRNKQSWLYRLPSLSTDGMNDALVLALQATASSYCGVELQDLALTRHAWDLYGNAVRRHGGFLERTRTGKGEITVHMISTSVLLSLFETMQATSADAYRSHVYGAARMFEVVDPKQCAEGVLCQIFFHLRTQMIFVQLTSRDKKMPVDIWRILHEALAYEELPIFQRLATHVSTLADIYIGIELDTLGGAPRQHIDLVEYMAQKSGIDVLWHEYTSKASSQHETTSWYDPIMDTICYRDAFTALTVAYFSGARILLGLIGSQCAASYLDLADHCESILDVGLYLQTYRIGCAFMRMAAPLLLVAIHAPRAKQRAIAVRCFESWKTGTVRGMSALALESIKSRRPLLAPRIQGKRCIGASLLPDEGVCMLMEGMSPEG